MKLILTLLIFFISLSSNAQFGNEWIDYSQKYYSFKIIEDGFYKIDYNTVTSAGIPVGSIVSDNFQIFGFEKEQSILVEDGGDGTFDSGDYILFYAQKNTTWLDSLLYDAPEDLANKYYPHYNDTITYFLTWNNQVNNNRMIEETDVNFGAYTPSPYLLKKVYKEFHSEYIQGFQLLGVSTSSYTPGEGWASYKVNALNATNYIDANLPTPFPYSGVGAPNIKGEAISLSASNAANSGGSMNHHLLLQYGTGNTLLKDTLFSGYKKIKFNYTFPAANIVSNTTRIRHQLVNDLGVAADHQTVACVDLTYPHLPNAEGSNYIEFICNNSLISSKALYNFVNLNATSPLAFSFENGIKKLPLIFNSTEFQVLVPNTIDNSQQKLIILDESVINTISTITPINNTGVFTNFSISNFNDSYIIISNKKLESSVNDYAAYRQSAAGGSNTVIIGYQNELCMQFGGGVPKHAMGIRRFQDFAFENALSVKPSHIFLIGKGVREANENVIQQTNGIRQSTYAYNNCLVPTFGYPVSDNLFTHHISTNEWEPIIPIGRLAALQNNDVIIYLDKIKEFELAQNPNDPYTLDSKYWQKNILHFGGGTTTSEQITFKYYLDQFANHLESSQFGGNVTSYYKDVSDPIDPVTLYNVTDQINEGVSIMTFYGHSYIGGFDQNVDDPENWDNQGKYPILISNSCLAGNIQEPDPISVSEEFVLIPNKGSIAFLASVNQAFSTGLYTFSNQLFYNMSTSNYGATLGELIKYSLEDLQPTVSFTRLTAMTQMTLHGDPAIKVNPHNKPELEINVTDFRVTPEQVNLSIDSIDVSIVVHNMGISVLDTFAIELKRSFPNNNGDSTYIKFLNGIDYNDTVVFTIPFYGASSAGINSFSIQVDQPSLIEEQYDEVYNNQITKQVIFDIDGISPVWPYKYAVVPNDTITLKASTINPFAAFNTYRFEIDTTDLFNSPELKYSIHNSLGGVLETPYNNWTSALSNSPTNLLLQDSTVYFWRTSLNDPTNYNWNESSFQYITGKSGWGQDHFFQFKNNNFNALNYERPTRELTFEDAGKSIECYVFGNAVVPQAYYTRWEIAGALQEYGICTYAPAFMVCVVDQTNLESWGSYGINPTTGSLINADHSFGNANDYPGCRTRYEKYFIFFQNDSLQMANMQNMLLNEIPDSNYVLIYSSRFISFADWDAHNPELYPFFQNLGSDSIALGSGPVPYICFYQKGNLNSFQEVYGANLNDDLYFKGYMFGKDHQGTETSTLIGPSTHWDAIYWDQHAQENPTTDTTRLKIIGLNYAGIETLLIDTLFTINDSIKDFNNTFPASDYPYLKLQSFHIDTIDNTPAQINRWHVLFTHVPEAALTSTNGYYISPTDTIDEGESLAFAFDIKNISDLSMDSLLVSYWIEDNEHNIIPIPYNRQDSLRVGSIIRDTINIESLGLKEMNSLWIEVNPYSINPYTTDQLEQYHFNNIGQIPFYVNTDNLNPLLDVTFNGYHILNGDLIDPKSEIIITLKDENEFLLLDQESDTSLFGIYLTDPNGVQKRLNFRNALGEQIMEWIPADGSNKKCRIIRNDNFTLDGIYRLLVQGSDKSGNISGDYSYDIEFEIDHHSSITNLMNYPNPFSTQTQFVFTLTGSVIPDEFTIQILTISGKVVREITVDELGSIHIGRNITDYRWDGKDEYGDILANGVYLYRVISKINGESIDHKETNADQYFSNDFGKMYIIR